MDVSFPKTVGPMQARFRDRTDTRRVAELASACAHATQPPKPSANRRMAIDFAIRAAVARRTTTAQKKIGKAVRNARD
jgi:hypothetical protein